VVVVEASIGVEPPLSPGLLSQAARLITDATTIAPIARRDLRNFRFFCVDPMVLGIVPHVIVRTIFVEAVSVNNHCGNRY